MDYQMGNETCKRLCNTFFLDEDFSFENLQKEFDADKTTESEASEKKADSFMELRSAVEKKILASSDYARRKAEIHKLIDDAFDKEHIDEDRPTEKEQEDINDEKRVKEGLSSFVKLIPNDKINSIHYTIVYLKTLMMFIMKNDCKHDVLKDVLGEVDIDYRLFPLQELVFYLYDYIKNTQKSNSITIDIQDRIRFNISNIVNMVLNKKGTITNEIIEVFEVYTQIMLFFNMRKQNKTKLSEDNISLAFSYIYYCLANAFIRSHFRDKQEALEYAKAGLNILEPSLRQDAFLTLGYCASNIDNQLSYDAYYTWIHQEVVGEIKEQNLYTITPAFGNDDSKWRMQSESKKKEATMHNNLAYTCSAIGDSFELGSVGRKKFYAIAKEEIILAIQMRKTAIDQENLDSAACSYYSTFGSIIRTPIEQTVPNDEASKKALEQYDLCLNTAREYHETIVMVRAICSSILTIMDILYYSFYQYSQKMKLNARSPENITVIADWMEKDKDNLNQYIKGLRKLSREYHNILEDDSFVLDREKNSSELESIRKTYPEVHDITRMINRYLPDKEELLQIVLLLMLVSRNTWYIRNRLCRLEYSNKKYYTRKTSIDESIPSNSNNKVIAYYTTLKTAKFLFDELYMGSDDLCPRKPDKSEQGKGKNCLTVVHAKYMNDPYEGMPLLEALAPISKSTTLFPNDSTTCLRDDIYNDTFVFLKSFTDQTDSLNMWNRYASDRSDKATGNDSNGCCVQFDPEMFHSIIYSKSTYIHSKKDNSNYAEKKNDKGKNKFNETKKELTSEVNDDYHLYRMIYLTRDGAIDRRKNPDLLPLVIEYYNNLKDILVPALGKSIENYFSKHTNKRLKKDIKNSIRQSLQFAIFLFKSDDYADENESRLIFVRDFDQQDTITLLPTEPAKLAINPYQQIYIKRIIFGPNVRDNEEWEPFFQYSLNKMWKKYAEETGDTSVPLCERYSIEKSSIHYHN